MFFFLADISPFKQSKSSDKTEKSASTIDLNASVNFTGTQFIIFNNDFFTWTNVKLEVNSGYKLIQDNIQPKNTYTVGSMQFAKSDGTRFNPLTMKPTSFSIYCDTPKGKGFWYGGWK